MDQPLRLEVVIQSIPPTLAYYRPSQPIALPVIGPGSQTATIRSALLVPLPLYEKVIIFVNRKPPTATPTGTPTCTPTPAPVQVDLVATGWEVTQAVQDLNNSVRLVAKKRTL